MCPYTEPDDTFHALQSHLFEILFHIILPSVHRSSKCSLFFRFFYQIPASIFLSSAGLQTEKQIILIEKCTGV
jgi:hypothetical protein